MQIEELVQLIANIGFPALMCLLMWRSNEKHVDTVQGFTVEMQSLTNKISEALDKLK